MGPSVCELLLHFKCILNEVTVYLKMWYGVMTAVLKPFCAKQKIFFFFALKRWDHSSNGELLLCFGMFYSEMTSCYRKTLLPSSLKVMSSRNQPEIKVCVVVFKKHTHMHKHTQFCFKCSKIIFSTFVFQLLFSKLLWTTNLIAHTVSTHSHTVQTHAPTHTHSWASHMDRLEHTCLFAPLKLFAVQSESSQTASRLLTSCLYSISIYPSILSSVFRFISHVSSSSLTNSSAVWGPGTDVSLGNKKNIETTDCSTRCISIEVKEDRWLMISP